MNTRNMTQADIAALIRELLNYNGFIPALTIHQPYASLLACGAKLYETRGWSTKYRGWVLIHAGMRPLHEILSDYDVSADTVTTMQSALGIDSPRFYGLPTGRIIAIAELVGCHEIHWLHHDEVVIAMQNGHAQLIEGNELLFGDWTPGRYAWEFANTAILDEPIPAKGKQGLWRWKGEDFA